MAFGQATETAATVEPGRWCFEADLFNHGRTGGGPVRTSYSSIGYLQFTRGWREAVDLQGAVQVYHQEAVSASEPEGLRSESREWARLFARAKWQWFINERHGWSSALLPYVAIPVQRGAAGDRSTDLGLILPISWSINERWCMDLHFQTEGVKPPVGRREWNWSCGANVQRAWSRGWGTYAEVLAQVDEESSSRAAVAVGMGVTREVARGLITDVAVYRGLTGEALDWELAIRLTWEL